MVINLTYKIKHLKKCHVENITFLRYLTSKKLHRSLAGSEAGLNFLGKMLSGTLSSILLQMRQFINLEH